MTATITTAELATALNTTPRELRKFLRADAKESGKTDELPGKGKRYALPANARSIAQMRKKFTAWEEAQKARKADDSIDADFEATAPESDNEVEPTDEDLANIED